MSKENYSTFDQVGEDRAAIYLIVDDVETVLCVYYYRVNAEKFINDNQHLHSRIDEHILLMDYENE